MKSANRTQQPYVDLQRLVGFVMASRNFSHLTVTLLRHRRIIGFGPALCAPAFFMIVGSKWQECCGFRKGSFRAQTAKT